MDIDAAAVSAAGLQAETLISSSGRSWRADFGGGILSQAEVERGDDQMTGPYPLAVMLSGTFPDTHGGAEPPAWPDAAAADAEAAGPAAPATALMPAPSQLLVIGCAKMFDDMVLQGAQNALLLLNAVDYLAGSEDVLTIRSRQLTQRTIGDVPAGQKLLWQLVTWVTMPALFIVLGVVRAVRRTGAAARYRRELRAAGEGRS